MSSCTTTVYKLTVPHKDLQGRSLRLAYFTDLHDCCSPDETRILHSILDQIRPDAVLCGGDSIIARPHASAERAVRFLLETAERHLLVIGTGNHEYRSRLYPETYGTLYEEYSRPLLDAGVCLLQDEDRIYSIRGIPVRIYGFDMPREYYGRLKKRVMPVSELYERFGAPDRNTFSVLLAHNPRALSAYYSWGADLTLCGHYHGGMMRIGKHHGLISAELRPFPHNAYGHFQKEGKHVIISSGCGEHTIPLRINNPREILLLEIRFAGGG